MMQGVRKVYLSLFAVVCALNLVVIETDCKKLGSHKPPSHSATVLSGKFPPPGVLFYHFIQPGKPLLMKNVLEETDYPAFMKWTDDYLSSNYGNEVVDIEKGKKENREDGNLELTLSNFIKVYNKSDLYMVHTVPETMQDEVLVPYSLNCGGFQHNIQEAVLWFSGGETKSVLHYDQVDNINCLLDGKKQLVLIDKEHAALIEETGWVEEGSYSQVDVDDIDPDMYPGILQAPWYQINMEKGDCVYIPYKWYHQVYSPAGRNFAVNLWFSHLWWFNQTDCKTLNKESLPMSQFNVASPNEQLRSDFLSSFADMKDISQERFIQDSGCADDQDSIKMWNLLNWKKDERLTWEEFYSFRMEDIVQRFPQCFHGTFDDEVADEFTMDNTEVPDTVEEPDLFEAEIADTEDNTYTFTIDEDLIASDNLEIPDDLEVDLSEAYEELLRSDDLDITNEVPEFVDKDTEDDTKDEKKSRENNKKNSKIDKHEEL